MEYSLQQMYSTINYVFKDESILKEALSPPFSNKPTNENTMIEFTRLKWLGDSILDMVVTDLLYTLFPGDSEGELTSKKMHLITADALLGIAEKIKIHDFLYFGQENRPLPCNRHVGNTIEAIIGAIYIDGGIEPVKGFISTQWESLLKTVDKSSKEDVHPKAYLEKWTQKHKLPLPEYTIIRTDGSKTNPTYEVKVCVERLGEAVGIGHSLREAKKQAAKILYDRIRESEVGGKNNVEDNGECNLN